MLTKLFTIILLILITSISTCTCAQSPYTKANNKASTLLTTPNIKKDTFYFDNNKIKHITLKDSLDSLIKEPEYSIKYHHTYYCIDFYESGKLQGISKFTVTMKHEPDTAGRSLVGIKGPSTKSVYNPEESIYFDSLGNQIKGDDKIWEIKNPMFLEGYFKY